MRILVHPPDKTPNHYYFDCEIDGKRRYAFGFETPPGGKPLNHCEFWDTFYPLFRLTRVPFLPRQWHLPDEPNLEPSEHEIQFEYPVDLRCVEFFKKRCLLLWQMCLDVSAPHVKYTGLPTPSEGSILCFGGGKDSRMLLGALREIDEFASVYAMAPGTASGHCEDVKEACVFPSLPRPTINDFVMPAIMEAPSRVYFGTSRAEALWTNPLRPFYDVSDETCLRSLGDMLQAVAGVKTQILAPLTVYSSNITQEILHTRYPELAEHQWSCRPQAKTMKNLSVALCRAYHGIHFQKDCSEKLFKSLLQEFCSSDAECITALGEEMRAICWKMRDDLRFRHVRKFIKKSWRDDSIDKVDMDRNPDVPDGLRQLLSSIY